MRYIKGKRPNLEDCEKQEHDTQMFQWMKRNETERMQSEIDDIKLRLKDLENIQGI